MLAALQSDSPLVDLLETCSLAAFSDCVSSAREVSLELAKALVDATGGVDAVFERFRDNDPWITEIEIASIEEELVGVARFLYLSESEQGDARERTVETGRLLLRTLPNITRVDVKAILLVDGPSRSMASITEHRGYCASTTSMLAQLRVTKIGFGSLTLFRRE